MSDKALMQLALGEQWESLPEPLKKHYENDENGKNIAEGRLTIDYPKFMQFPLNFLRLMGALLNRRGDNLETTVERKMEGERQYWHRTIRFADGKQIHFKSQFVYHAESNELIEYTSPFLGLKMKVHVENGRLKYESTAFVLKLGSLLIPIPENLMLGHASIIETARDDGGFDMDFRIKHPWFGEIFSYAGSFRTL